MGGAYAPTGAEDYTYEPTEVLNMMVKTDRDRLAELRNLELQCKIEILHENELITPRMITQDGDVYEAKIERVIEFATISKPIIDEVPNTSV